MPLASIFIPSYNHENFISDTLKSVFKQTIQDFEIIISDDNSSDDTCLLIKGFNDSRIKLIENKINSGPSCNSTIAISNCTGKYLVAIASDDMMFENRIEETTNFLEKNHEYDAVFTFVETIDENCNPVKSKIADIFNQDIESDHILKKLFSEGNFLCGTSLTIRKVSIEKTGDHNFCLLQLQDYDYWIRMLLNNLKIKIIPKVLTKYRVHKDNLSKLKGGPDKSFMSRIAFEYSCILPHFAKIDDVDKISKFVDLSNYKVVDNKYIKFYIAMECLEVAKKQPFFIAQSYKNFSLSLMNEVLNDKNLREEIYKQFNFSMKNFYEISSQNPIIEIVDQSKLKKKKSIIKKIKNSLYKRLRNEK